MSDQSLQPAAEVVTTTPIETEAILKPQSNLLREIVETALLTAIIFLVVNAVIGRFRIESVSMQPNLYEGEYVIVDKISYTLSTPQRGDIIVFEKVGQPDLIKRVIGLPGDTVEVRNQQVFVNGVALKEPYIANPPNYAFGPVQVEPGRYFVLGDNRSNSSDSHVWGTIPADTIVGRAWIIYWPPPNWQIVPHYSYAVAEAR
ncbi:MAG: signal peptidase I [Thermoflexales bacterium]|nr:signal peptidase I [Thermoflexales bacterium]